MNKHAVIWGVSLSFSLGLGWLDDKTNSWLIIFYNPGNAMTLLLYTAIFAGIIYSSSPLKLVLKKLFNNLNQ